MATKKRAPATHTQGGVTWTEDPDTGEWSSDQPKNDRESLGRELQAHGFVVDVASPCAVGMRGRGLVLQKGTTRVVLDPEEGTRAICFAETEKRKGFRAIGWGSVVWSARFESSTPAAVVVGALAQVSA